MTIIQDNFFKTGRASVIIDGQFGSTGKGLAAAWVCGKVLPDICVTNAAPNAGHTTRWHDGREIVLNHLPTSSIVAGKPAYLNAGSVIDPETLVAECIRCGWADKKNIVIHPRAAVIEQEDKDYEMNDHSATTRLASTRKGVGRALARKVMRESKLAADNEMLNDLFTVGIINMADSMSKGMKVLVEIPQGMSLSLNHGQSYPYCTSRDVSVAQGLADAGIPPHFLGPVMLTARTYPIRVGHIVVDDHADHGNGHGRIDKVKLGDSGPCYPDQREIEWSSLGIEPELTTVTKRPRRIFTWSNHQYQHALSLSRPDVVFLNFVNYLRDEVEMHDLFWRMSMAEEVIMGTTLPKVWGLGPCVEDMTVDIVKVKESVGRAPSHRDN